MSCLYAVSITQLLDEFSGYPKELGLGHEHLPALIWITTEIRWDFGI